MISMALMSMRKSCLWVIEGAVVDVLVDAVERDEHQPESIVHSSSLRTVTGWMLTKSQALSVSQQWINYPVARLACGPVNVRQCETKLALALGLDSRLGSVALTEWSWQTTSFDTLDGVNEWRNNKREAARIILPRCQDVKHIRLQFVCTLLSALSGIKSRLRQASRQTPTRNVFFPTGTKHQAARLPWKWNHINLFFSSKFVSHPFARLPQGTYWNPKVLLIHNLNKPCQEAIHKLIDIFPYFLTHRNIFGRHPPSPPHQHETLHLCHSCAPWIWKPDPWTATASARRTNGWSDNV